MIDVGCSNEKVTKTAQDCLKKYETHITTTRIGDSPSVRSDATKNLDCFEQSDVFSSYIDRHVGKADVAICINMANDLYKLLSARDSQNNQKMFKVSEKGMVLVTDASDAGSLHGMSHLDWQCVSLSKI